MLGGVKKGAAYVGINIKICAYCPLHAEHSRTARNRGRSEIVSEETQRLAGVYEQKLAALEALKKSLLHQAFTGKL